VSLNPKQVKVLLKFFNLIQSMYNRNNRTRPKSLFVYFSIDPNPSHVLRWIKGLFERALLQKLQLWFSSFTVKQLQQIVKVSSRNVWFAYGLQLL
jgi:hypothetical protein